MFVFRQWRVVKKDVLGGVQSCKDYKVLLLLGIIPLYISING